MGKVVLVGAGPGDEGLLTLKGEKYIKEAIIAGANYEIGHGHGPVKHFYNIWKED